MAVTQNWHVLILLLIGSVHCQINSLPGSSQTTFYLDASSDCDGRIRNVGQSSVNIFGKTTVAQGKPMTSCTVTLKTDNVREPYRFKLQFLAVTIYDPGVQFYVYDGEFNGRLRWAFSKNTQKPESLTFDFTTGQLVTFRLSRGELDKNYDIRIVATPVRSDVARCTYENEYGCDEYGYNYRLLGTKEIVGIVAGCFALVVVIVIIVVVCCYRKQRGISQKWKEEKLGHVNTAASLHSLGGKYNTSTAAANSSSKPWSTESSRNGFASIRRSPNLPRAKISRSFRSADNASSDLSDSNANVAIPVKRPLPPTSVSYNPRGTSNRSGRSRGFRDRDRDSDKYSDYSSDTGKNYSEKNYRPPTYREAIRTDLSESSADETSFVQANDDHPQKVFIEREIIPTKMKQSVSTGTQGSAPLRKQEVKPSPRTARSNLPPPEEDMTYDSIEPKKDRKALLKKEAEKESDSEEEIDESDTDNESEEEEEEEDSEEEESEEESEDEVEKETKKSDPPVYSQSTKRIPNPDKVDSAQPIQSGRSAFVPPAGTHQPLAQFPGGLHPAYLPTGLQHPQARYPGYQGYPPGQYPPAQPQGPVPQQGYPISQTQQYPGPQPQAQPNAYHQANFSVPLQQPQGMMPNTYNSQYLPQAEKPQAKHHSHRPSNRDDRNPSGLPNGNGGQIPVYSYLVNRGYQPLDPGRHSPVSSSTGASNLSRERNILNEDSDYGVNLDSGVELLKRRK